MRKHLLIVAVLALFAFALPASAQGISPGGGIQGIDPTGGGNGDGNGDGGQIPEPVSLVLLAAGVAGYAILRRKRKA